MYTLRLNVRIEGDRFNWIDYATSSKIKDLTVLGAEILGVHLTTRNPHVEAATIVDDKGESQLVDWEITVEEKEEEKEGE